MPLVGGFSILLGSQVDDVSHAQALNFRGAAIGGKGALDDSQRPVWLDSFGESHKFLAVGQRGFDVLSDCAAALSVRQSDSFRSTGLTLDKTGFELMQELRKKPMALDAASCFLVEGCGRFSQVFWELAPIPVDVQPHADHLKRLRSRSRSTFAQDAADLAFAEEHIVRPFDCDAGCGNQFDGFSRSQGSQ